MNRFTVGFSVNPELSFSFRDGLGEKGILESLHIDLSGSSANICKCLQNLGHPPLLLVPIEAGSSDAGELLDIALKKSELPNAKLRVLSQSPCAIYPIGDRSGNKTLFYGKKGVVDVDRLNTGIDHTLGQLDGEWRVASGIDFNTAPLAAFLLSDGIAGKRVFSPHHTLCKNENKHLVRKLLKYSDMLILNEIEFKSLNMSMPEIHSLGISVIVITMAENGGFFSVQNNSVIRQETTNFYAAKPPTDVLYNVGPGDWFNGSLLSYFEDNRITLDTVTSADMESACAFAARVAAIKITMKGGSNGPKREDLF